MPAAQPSTELHIAAQRYLQHGWSVIPIFGTANPQRPKAAAIAWKVYQRQHPSEEDLFHWFVEQQRAGIAVVTGTVSHLVVLDLDDRAQFTKLQHHLPELTQTYTVQTRRGLHLYWRADFTLPSQPITGGDLKAEGSYVIAPPTHLSNFQYATTTDQDVKPITCRDLQNILRLLRPTKIIHRTNSKLTTSPVNAGPTLVESYHHQAALQGRNNALYHTAQRACSSGWSLQEAQAQLVPVHLIEPPHHPHPTESTLQRYHEAIATIASAYRRSKRAKTSSTHRNTHQLPNTLREKLLNLPTSTTKPSCAVARVLDGLLLLGWAPGRTFTTHQAIRACQPLHIGRESVLKTLHARSPTGEHIIPRKSPPPVGGGARPNSNRRGRPTRQYTFPDIDDLCRVLGVEASATDALTPEALGSPKAYRQALHRSLLERREGCYSRDWLGRRLGVSRWTVQRYHRELSIVATPVLGFQTLSWETLDEGLPKEKPTRHDQTWLVDETGKRYPPVRGLGGKLLKQGKTLTLVRQQPNHYRLKGEGETPLSGAVLWRCLACDTLIPGQAHSPPHECTACCDPSKESRHALRRETLSMAAADRPVVTRTVLTFATVSQVVPPDEFFQRDDGWWRGQYLVVPETGKKYPPLRGLAYRLLKQYGEGGVVYVLRYQRDD